MTTLRQNRGLHNKRTNQRKNEL